MNYVQELSKICKRCPFRCTVGTGEDKYYGCTEKFTPYGNMAIVGEVIPECMPTMECKECL